MSTLVVQERHLWLTLADMRESDKHRFLDSPISQAGLFGEAVEGFAQQFSAAQQQTEAFRHILPRRSAAVSTPPPAAAPPSARRRTRPPAASTSAPARPQQQPSQRHSVELAAGKRRSPSLPLPNLRSARPSGGPETGDPESLDPALQEVVTAPLLPPEEGRVENLLFPFILFRHWLSSQWYPNLKKRAVSFFSGSQEGEDGSARDPVSTLPSPSPFAYEQQGPVRGRDAFSRTPCSALEPGKCCTAHSGPTSERTAFRVGPLCSTSLPHRGYVCGFPGPACTVSGGLASAPQAVSLAHENHQTWLRDSVRPASSQVQGRSVHLCVEQGCPSLACGSRGPAGEGRDRAGPSSRDEVGVLQPVLHRTQESGGLRPILDLRVLNRALHKLPFRMLTQRRIFQCIRPFDWFAAIDLKDAYFMSRSSLDTDRFFALRSKGEAYQYKVLPFGLSLSPRVFTKVVEAALVPLREAGIRVLKLPRRLAHIGPVSSTVVRTQGHGAQPPQPVGASGSTGKRATLPVQRISFLGMELDSVNLTARLSVERAQSMLNCLESFQCKRAVPLKHFQRLLGHMASAAAVTQLGLLHMRPLQHWLHDRVPRWAWRRGTYRVSVTPSCRQTFGRGRILLFFGQEFP